MSVYRTTYCTREAVQLAGDIKESARRIPAIDRAIQSASGSVEKQMNRIFFPRLATKYFDWPSGQYSRSWRLWLDENELIVPNSVFLRGTSTVLPPSSYLLEPVNSGPPYNRVEIDVSAGGGASASFGGSAGTQRAVGITGVWGYDNNTRVSGTVAVDINASEGQTLLRVTDSALLGVGDQILVEQEWMVIGGKSYLDTDATLTAGLSVSMADCFLDLDTSVAVSAGETIMIDSEMMMVDEVIGTSVLVRRAWSGTALAAHSVSAPVYAPRLLQVIRAYAGSTAASHLAGTTIYAQMFPSLIQELTLAEAMTALAQETAGFARTIGSGDNTRESAGKGLSDLRCQAFDAHGRKSRIQVV